MKNEQRTKQDYGFVKSIPAPDGYERITDEANSFGGYLRNLELKKGDNTVYLFNGNKKGNQNAQYAVINIDVGDKDLQQCADAVMRLRAEYLYAQKKYDDIHFNFVSGFNCQWNKYADGYRVSVKGNNVSWVKTAEANDSYETLRNYLDLVFTYAGTASLIKELNPISINDIRLGDVFIQKGTPYGHAIIVVDAAVNKSTGKKVFMLAQSYMPAQDIHILKNPNDQNLSPWYSSDFGETLETPEWEFKKEDLKRF